MRIGAGLVMVLLSAATLMAYEPLQLSPQAGAEDVAILRQALEEIHAGYGRYTSAEAMRAELDALAARASAGVTDAQLYRDVSRLLALIRCDHTKAELPEPIRRHREAVASYLPFAFRVFAGRMYVAAADDATGLRRGDEILAINGRDVGAIFEEVRPLLSVDGWTDPAKWVELENGGGELMGDGVNHFWPFLYGWPEKWDLRVRGAADGAVRQVEAGPITFDAYGKLAAVALPAAADFRDGVSFRVTGDSAVLKIDTFVNYRSRVDPLEKLLPLFEEIERRGVRHLVLDLRDCGGGSDEVVAALGGLLLRTIPAPSKAPWLRAIRFDSLRPHLRTWDDSIFRLDEKDFRRLDNGYYEQISGAATGGAGHPSAFTGRLTVLIGPANQSGATIAIALLKAHRPDTWLVGQPTGGSAEGPTAGTILFLTLPNSGIVVRVPAIRSRVNAPFVPGLGVAPDIEIPATAADWLAGRDPALDEALRGRAGVPAAGSPGDRP